MTVFIGMDEAGYGPLLGPLIVARAELAAAEGEPRLPIRPDRELRIGDSKEILHRRDGLALLEAVVLGFHASRVGSAPATLADLLELDGRGDLGDRLRRLPWYADLDLPLPFAAEPDRVARAWEAADKGELLGGARFLGFGLRVMPEDELNGAWERSGNKHTSLFTTVVELIEEGLQRAGREVEGARVSVDKLGGRSYYEDMLAGAFPFVPIEVLEEERRDSRYRLQLPAGDVDLRFMMKGDSRCAEIALASMLAKYTREALMKVFNAHFEARCPGLLPTAGYYEDGRRFLGDLAAAGLLDASLADALERRR